MNVESGGFECYALFHALKLHFTTKYDFVKYSGKTNVTQDSFMIRKDKFTFYKLSRKYGKDDMFGFFVSNLLEKPKLWSGDLLSEDAESTFKTWQKTQQSLFYNFQQDLSTLMEDVASPQQLLMVVDRQYPLLYNSYMQSRVKLETVMIMNDILNFFPMWIKRVDDDLIFPEFIQKCMKYAPFLNYDVTKYKHALKSQMCAVV